MHGESSSIIHTLAELDASWLQRTLQTGPIADFSSEQIGTGQMSESHRISLSYADADHAGPAAVVLKLASADPTSRATGVGLGIYAREVRFYEELAARIGGPLAACRLAAYDEQDGWFTLVLEDISPAEPGDQIEGCSVARAQLAIAALARLHAPVLGDPALAAADWLNQPSLANQALVAQLLPGFLERHSAEIRPEHRALCERFVATLDAWLCDRRPPFGLVHGDFRLDNLLFGAPGSVRALTVVDWQTVGWGAAMADLSYFLGGSLELADRRRHERELFEQYHQRLLDHGAQGIDREDCWSEYRRHAFVGVLMVIVASMLVQRTERGDRMFMTMLARHCQQALDLSAQELLPALESSRPAPLRAKVEDEGAHAPGSEALWNESWYFDAISPDGALGVWVRIGLYPNLDACWYTAFVCGPGRPTIAVVDFAAPLPADGHLSTRTDLLRAEHRCDQPLQRFDVALEATGDAHEDAAALLRGERGRATPTALDLTWETCGVPYAYRLTTRYEIPCVVSGTIRVGEQVFELERAPGQRDHSWGARDWWSMDWVWSAAHLDDGSHLHAVQLRLPDMPTIGAGYVQSADGELIELDRVSADEQVAADGLISSARLSLEPTGLLLDVEPLAFAPLLLRASDGRVSHFPRAMCEIRCADGRKGLAWVEWNLNQPASHSPDDPATPSVASKARD